MAIVVSEKYKGQTGDAVNAEVIYLVQGTGADVGTVTDSDAFDAVGGSAPSTWRNLPLANIQIREELLQGTIWLVAAIYGGSEGDSTVFPQETTEYEFSFQAPSEHILQSIRTIGVYGFDDEVGEVVEMDPDWFFGAINASVRNGETTIEGVDLPGGSPTSTWVFKPLNETISDAYQVGVESIMGNVNSFMFKNRAAGTMRFVSCDGGSLFTGSAVPKWTIRFGFQFAPNRLNFDVGPIRIPRKNGHHLMWSYFIDDFKDADPNPANRVIVKRPQFVVVEQVFPESNFNVLGI